MTWWHVVAWFVGCWCGVLLLMWWQWRNSPQDEAAELVIRKGDLEVFRTNTDVIWLLGGLDIDVDDPQSFEIGRAQFRRRG